MLEKQGLCSQATRQPPERSASLPPSSLPRPKRSPGKKLGEYGRLSDTSTSKETSKGDQSPVRIIPLGRKVGEYGRLSDSESRKTSDSDKLRESPARSLLPPRSYSRLESDSSTEAQQKKIEKERSVSRSPVTSQKVSDTTEVRMSPVQKYNRFFEKPSPESSTEYQSSKRSFLPPPRKISDYGCFEEQAKPESKLRRGSLHREQQGAQQQPPKTGVRSLPSPNKYRIQF